MKNSLVKLLCVIWICFGLFSAVQANTPALMTSLIKSTFTLDLGADYTDDQYRKILTSQIWVYEQDGISMEMEFFKNGHLDVNFYQVSPRIRFANAKANWRVTNAQLCIRYYEQSDPRLNLVTGIERCNNLNTNK